MTVDNSAYGGDNGHGGRTYDSVQQIVDKQVREQAAIEKAAEPTSLTHEDLVALPGAMAAELMAAGKVAHLGYGRRHTGRRH